MTPDDEGASFKIWAVDNVVYGPVDLPTLVGWVKEERVTADTWIHIHESDEWRKAERVPELQMFFRTKADSPMAGRAAAPEKPAAGGIKPTALRRLKIFAGMGDVQLERFFEFMELQPVRQWVEIVKQGSPGDAMYLILEGEVRVRLMIAGKETILTALPAGEFFGEIALFDHGPRSADVVANVDAILLKISATTFQKLVNEAPDLAAPFLFAVGKTLTARIRADNKRYHDSVNFARASR